MKIPWDFSEAPDLERSIPNTPTSDGRALGVQIARLADIEERKQLEQFPNMLPRCNECAARAGTDPNGCPETLMDFVKCIVEGVPFYCHKGIDTNDPNAKMERLCSGFMILASAGDAVLRALNPIAGFRLSLFAAVVAIVRESYRCHRARWALEGI